MEIIRDGVDGFHWRDVSELKRRTLDLIGRPDLLASCRSAATVRSGEFLAREVRKRNGCRHCRR